jgi:hypothetical protein
MFDLADKGDKIIIKRGKKRAYVLTPIDDNRLVRSPTMMEKIERGLQNIRDGKTKRYTREELSLKMNQAQNLIWPPNSSASVKLFPLLFSCFLLIFIHHACDI